MAKRERTGLTYFEGLYGDRQARPGRAYLFVELLETRSADFGWQIEPHTHPGIMQVFFIETGNFEFQETGQTHKLQAPCLLVIPSTVLHGFRFNDQVRGRIITLSEVLFASLWKDTPALTGLASRLIRIMSFSESYPVRHISELIATIKREQAQNDTLQNLMLTACLQQLFLCIYRLDQYSNGPKTEHGAVDTSYLRKLQQVIHESQGQRSVEDIAAELNISAVHLNRVCQKATGRSVSGLVNDYLIEEAKKYLSYTNLSVAEIAYLLHFDYPNYFARFFRKHTGFSPLEFRKI